MNKSSIQVRIRNIEATAETEKWRNILSNFKSTPVVNGMHQLSYEEYSKLMRAHPDFKNSSACVVQSWSSALPPVFLFSGLINQKNTDKKFDIIDACSAPGNKTLQLG